MHYIGDLKQRFGAWPLTLAAFNSGYGAVIRAMQKYNTNDYWELCQHEDGLPWETTLYVPKVMATALVDANRARFGFENVQPDPPYVFDRVSVPSSMSVAAIARAAGVSASRGGRVQPRAAPQADAARGRGRSACRAAAAPSSPPPSTTIENWLNHSSFATASGSTTWPRRTASRRTSCAPSTESTTAPRSARA